jgi:hypothetical protein
MPTEVWARPQKPAMRSHQGTDTCELQDRARRRDCGFGALRPWERSHGRARPGQPLHQALIRVRNAMWPTWSRRKRTSEALKGYQGLLAIGVAVVRYACEPPFRTCRPK